MVEKLPGEDAEIEEKKKSRAASLWLVVEIFCLGKMLKLERIAMCS